MMRWVWLPLLLVLSGCSIMVPLLPLPISSPAPDSDAGIPAESIRQKRSVVRISGVAPSCGMEIEGTGFVYAPQRVVTVAHVVAGVFESLTVTADDGKAYEARVVAFDPDVDVAVLYVPDLSAPPLLITDAPPGDTHLIGYPKDAKHAVVRRSKIEQRVEAEGPDIYRKHNVTRKVLMLSADMGLGLAGAPLVRSGGTVAGMAFAMATKDPNRGYALPAEELLPITKGASDATRQVSTRQCD